MGTDETIREQVATRLRDEIAAFDADIQPPADLVHHVTAGRADGPRDQLGYRVARRGLPAVLAACAVGILAGGIAGATWQRHQAPISPLAGSADVRMVVYNAEAACQRLRTIECALSVRSDPYHTDPDNVVARVWHGDRAIADCVVEGGKFFRDEEGVSSQRWYHVTTASGAVGYLPGVRTRNTVEVARCATD